MSDNRKVRVVVGDDHPLFRDGLVRALSGSGEVEVVAEAEDGTSALAAIKEHTPDVALLDYRMPGMDGAEVAAAVRRDELPTRVLLVSAHDDAEIVYHALQQGAAGYLPKDSSRSEIVNAVLDCAKGRDVLAPGWRPGWRSKLAPRRAVRTVAELAGTRSAQHDRRGRSIPAIAEALFLAPSTVKTHVQRLYEVGCRGPRGGGRRGDAAGTA